MEKKEYKLWLGAAEMMIEGAVLRVKVKSDFSAEWIQTDYMQILKDAA